jgi:UV excision repair protein RAD23
MGAQRDAAIQNMMEMGFPREDIDRAMRAAFNNPDRAVEYLMTVRV